MQQTLSESAKFYRKYNKHSGLLFIGTPYWSSWRIRFSSFTR